MENWKTSLIHCLNLCIFHSKDIDKAPSTSFLVAYATFIKNNETAMEILKVVIL